MTLPTHFLSMVGRTFGIRSSLPTNLQRRGFLANAAAVISATVVSTTPGAGGGAHRTLKHRFCTNANV
jgi:hypothetical protein